MAHSPGGGGGRGEKGAVAGGGQDGAGAYGAGLRRGRQDRGARWALHGPSMGVRWAFDGSPTSESGSKAWLLLGNHLYIFLLIVV